MVVLCKPNGKKKKFAKSILTWHLQSWNKDKREIIMDNDDPSQTSKKTVEALIKQNWSRIILDFRKSLISARDNSAGDIHARAIFGWHECPPNFARAFCLLFLSLTDVSHYMASRWLCQCRLVHRVSTLSSLILERKISEMKLWESKGGLSHVFFPRVHYSDALQLAGLEPIRAHEESLTEKVFQSIISNPPCKIFSLLPPSSNRSYELRKQRRLDQPIVMWKTQITFPIKNHTLISSRVSQFLTVLQAKTLSKAAWRKK